MYEKLQQNLYLENTNQNLGMPTKCVLTFGVLWTNQLIVRERSFFLHTYWKQLQKGLSKLTLWSKLFIHIHIDPRYGYIEIIQ